MLASLAGPVCLLLGLAMGPAGVLGCSLSVHGELLGCVGAPTTPMVESSYVPPLLFSVLEVGGVHACAIQYPSGGVLCWDTSPTPNQPVQTRAGPADAPAFVTDARSLSLGAEHSCALWGVKNTLTCWGMDIGVLSPSNVSHNVRMLAVGHPLSRHVCFLYVSKTDVSCIGQNNHGQLGLGAAGESIDNVPSEYIVSYT
jgi:hypothetical protein